MSNESEKHDDEQTSTGDGIPEDALGDTYLGKNLGHLIREIGQQHKKILEGAPAEGASGTGTQDSDTADRMERLNEALEVVDASKADDKSSAPAGKPKADDRVPWPKAAESGAEAGSTKSRTDEAISTALSEIESTLRRFVEVERRRHEEELAGWRNHFKKAAMVVIKKQVEAARANWIRKSSENEAKVAGHYKKLKILADKVAKQKIEIQKAKQELKEKLEIADRLHVEFDSIRQVLDGKLGVLDALEKDDEQG